MSDTPIPIINYDATHNTIIRISEQDTVNQIYYPRQLQIQTFQGTSISKFDVQGLQLLDINNNWYYVDKCLHSLIIVYYYVVIILKLIVQDN